MNRINEYGIEPGTYQHYKGGIYVVTHMDSSAGKGMEPLPDPLVVYRDLDAIVKHVNGKPKMAHQRYARKLSEFNGITDSGVKRFEKV